MTTIKFRDFANVKRTAGIVQPLVAKKNRIAAQIEALYAEYNTLKEQIETHQDWVKSISGGFTTEQLVVRKKDAEGKEIQGYDANPSYVRFDEEKRCYVVCNPNLVAANEESVPMSPAECEAAAEAEEQQLKGSDFDGDDKACMPEEGTQQGFDPEMA